MAYWTQREVIGVAGAVLTLDRPVRRPYSNNDVVSVCTTARDIKIYGGGMQISGSAVAITQLTTARDCYVEDVHAANIDMQFAHVWDVASRDCKTERCTVDCGGITPGAYLLAFGAENIDINDCDSYNAGPGGAAANVYIASADDCRITGGVHAGSTGTTLIMTRDDVSDTIGCQNCIVDGGAWLKAVAGAIDVDIGTVNQIYGADTSYSQSGIVLGINANATLVDGGSAQGNTVYGITNSGTGNRVVGHAVTNQDAPAYAAQGGSFECSACMVDDTSTAAVADAHFTAFLAGTVFRVNGCRVRVATRALQHFARCYSGAKMYFDGGNRFDATGANCWGVIVDQGVVRVAGTVINSTGAGSIGVATNGAAGFARIADDVDVSACPTPFASPGGGNFNRGRIALTAAAALAIAFGDTKATDQFKWSYETNVGATGVVISGAPVVGTGYNIVGLAGDTSIINYSIGPS